MFKRSVAEKEKENDISFLWQGDLPFGNSIEYFGKSKSEFKYGHRQQAPLSTNKWSWGQYYQILRAFLVHKNCI
jgi:hypothetical protein